jgi:TonB family protein
MRQTLIAPLTLIVIWSSGLSVQAQIAKATDQKSNTPATDQKATAATTSDTDQPNEVEQMLAEARKRGEPVVGTRENSEEGPNRPLNENVGYAIHLAKPAYPPLARAAHIQGSVEVRVLIDFDGKVIAAAAISGHPLLQGVSVKAARDSEFTPMKLEGQPVKVTGIIRYDFFAQ